MLDCGEATVGCCKLGLLQLDERGHLIACVAMRQVEHRVVQCVETSQCDELELVTHSAQLFLELGDGGIVQILLPVERWRAVVGQQLAWELGMNRFSEFLGERQIRFTSLAPHQIRVRRVGQATRDGLINTWLGLVEAFNGALTSAERLVVIVNIRSQQISGFCVGTRDQNGWCAHHVSSQTCGIQLLNRFTGWYQYLATHVAALLH